MRKSKTRNPYARFALLKNPFNSESSDVSLLHVHQDADDVIDEIFFHTLCENGRALLNIVGPHGIGKTERLLLIQDMAEKERAFSYYTRCSSDSLSTIEGFIDHLTRRWLFMPRALKKLRKIGKKLGKKPIDMKKLAKEIAKALDEIAPCFLLFDDIDLIRDRGELLTILQEILERSEKGVMIAIATDAMVDKGIRVELEPLTSREAELLLAKRILAARSVGDDLDPLFPFTGAAVGRIFDDVGGNPGELLEKTKELIDSGVRRRAMIIDEEFVERA